MIKKLIGLFIVIVGIFLFLSNLEILNFGKAMEYLWPSLIIMIGIVGMYERKKFDLVYFIIFLLGLDFLFNNLELINGNFMATIFWPVILVLFGSSLLFRKDLSLKSPNNQKYYTAVLGGLTEKNNDNEFVQCDITTIFGGGKIDFSDMKLKDDKGYINVISIFGGMELILPKEYNVISHGLPIFGACENKLKDGNKNSKKQIIINYTVIFGGIDLKN